MPGRLAPILTLRRRHAEGNPPLQDSAPAPPPDDAVLPVEDEHLEARTRFRPVALRAAGGLLLLGFCLWVLLGLDAEAFAAWKREAGPIPFFLALAVLPAFGLPTTPFYLLAGATYGVVVGLAGSSVALAANLALCYWIAKSGMRPALERLLARTKYTLPQVKPGREAHFVLAAKLMPGVPTFVKNYLICLGGVGFGVYFGISFVVTALYAGLFVVLGESLYDQDWGGAAWALGGLVALGVAFWLIRKRVKSREVSKEA